MNGESFINLKNQCSEFLTKVQKNNPDKFNGLAFSIISIEKFRLDPALARLDEYLTKEEIAYCNNRIPSLCGRYTAKLAVHMALGEQIPWNTINIVPSISNQPMIPSMPNIAVSITHEKDLSASIACVSNGTNKLAVGLDAALTSRLSAVAIDQPKILDRIFTPRELKEINNNEISAAEKWASKESVSKALGTGIWSGTYLHDIEILDQNKNPEIILKNGSLTRAQESGFKNWTLGIMHDPDFTISIVIAED